MQTRAVHANKATLDGKALQSELDKLGGRSTDALHRVMARSSSSVAISEERRASQTSASNSGATPVKSGGGTELGLSEVSRAHIERHERRLKSRDLIEALFGSLVDLDEAHSILLELLRTKVLSAETIGPKVGIKGKVVAVTAYKAACDHAVAQAKHFVAPTSIRSSPDKYRWKWMVPVAASEEGVALFLNVVAIAAHAAAVRSGTGNTLPCIRFLTPPNPHAAVPLSYESSQDCRPDVVGVKYDMLDTKPTKTNPNAPPRFFPLPNCPFKYIRKHFPSILRAETNTNPHRKNILAFIKWFEKQSLRTHLDLWRFCWPELRLTAEGKLNDLPSAILEELVYMQQQRRSQPWMRSVIGLVVTTDTIGVLGADSLGVEECTFKRESSRGVLDAVRLCLGLVRSNGVQRGRHEAFELGPVKTWAPPHVQTQATKQRTTQPTPTSTVAYTHRTVRFIKLDGGDKIHHPKNSTVADVRYYVHHMIQDDGSLVGRCPRIFCVSRQEKGPDDKTALFIGPYVLKIYYADHSSECFKENLIDEARKGQVQNVLLPTWEWHYGDALSKRGYGPEIVLAYKNGDAVVPHVASNREEVFAQSDLKRVLAQCTNRKEFLAAFIDFTIGIASLEEKKLTTEI
ncbi:hypothetical protein K438DRAFT_611024 [Mycena galopus ATCC 62051]|nr:hypothetical protein K438DRAFT_611024 [Mycena galopus ATCC 62051]